MMVKRQYHCLISGLPSLFFDGDKPWTSPAAFREMLAEDLHPEDYGQVELIFIKEDHLNLADFLCKEKDEPLRPGNFFV